MAKLQSGTVVYGNLTVNTFANINGNLILGAQLYAAGSPGTNGQVLQNVGGTGVAWANPSSGSSIFNGTSNVTVLTSGSNVVISVAGSIIANIGASGLTIIGGLSAGTITGNGATLTGLPAGYSNVNAATYLPIYSGTVGASFVNSTGNVLAQAGVFNALGINGAITGTGYINTTSNISTAQLNAGQINTTGNLLSTGGIFNALTVNGTITSTGYFNTTANIASTGAVHNSLNVNGLTTITDTASAASSTTVFAVKNGGFQVAAYGRLGSGNYNPLVGTDDCAIITTGGNGQSSGNLFIGPWSVNNTGIRIVGNTGLVQIPGQMTIHANNSSIAIANGGTNGTGDFGATGATFGVFYGTATTARYADLAEVYTSDKKYVPGTVVIFGGNEEVTISTQSHDTRIAGVISTNPAYLMNSEETGVAVALTGRVPCRVQGPVSKGDRLVSSDQPGVATILDKALYEPGCVIGKALEEITEARIQTIEVVVGRV